MVAPRNTFSKKEKLKSKKAIDLLFSKGKGINAYPIRAMVLPKCEVDDVVLSAGFSVPKRNIKLAVNRNVIKRRMREAYRLNNKALKLWLTENEKGIDLMLIYTAKQIHSYQEIEEKIKVILTRLIDKSETNSK